MNFTVLVSITKEKMCKLFFAENGNLIATGTRITENQLPLLILKAIDAQYAGYSKTEVFEFTMDGETKYLLTLNKNNKNYVIKASGNGDLEVHKKASE